MLILIKEKFMKAKKVKIKLEKRIKQYEKICASVTNSAEFTKPGSLNRK